MSMRMLSVAFLICSLSGTAGSAAGPHACGLPSAFDPFMGALPGPLVTLSGTPAKTFLRVAEIAEEPFEKLVVLFSGDQASVLAIVHRGNLVCARRLSLPRDRAQWGLNMAFGEDI